MSSLRTLGEISARTSMLSVAFSRCERRGRYRLEVPIERHGANAPPLVTVPELTADCPHRGLAALMGGATFCFPGWRRC